MSVLEHKDAAHARLTLDAAIASAGRLFLMYNWLLLIGEDFRDIV